MHKKSTTKNPTKQTKKNKKQPDAHRAQSFPTGALNSKGSENHISK